MFFLDTVANTICALNVARLQRNCNLSLPACKKNILLLNKLRDVGILESVELTKDALARSCVSIKLAYAGNSFTFRKIKLISKISKKYNVRVKTLSKFYSHRAKTQFIISTSRGLKTELEAIQQNIGGYIILAFVY